MSDICLNYSYRNVVFYTILSFVAIVTHESVYGLFLSIPQFIYVLYLLYRRNVVSAYKWHIIFSLTCIAIPLSSLTEPGVSYVLYNYTKLKIVGPISVSLLLTLLILFACLQIEHKLSIKDFLFYRLFKILLILGLYGIVVGCFGLLFFKYNKDVFISFSVYIIPILLNCFILLALDSKGLKKKMYFTMIELLISTSLASLLCYLSNITSTYSNDVIIPQNELGYYSILLIFGVFYLKRWIVPFLAVLISLWLLKFGGVGGKGIIVDVVVLMFFFLILFQKENTQFKVRIKFFRIALFVLLSIFGFSLISIFATNDLFLWKFESVLSLFDIFNGIDAISLMPNSPKVRVVSFLDIMYGFKDSPIMVFLGTGYGGYFYDHSGLLSLCDLSHAFSDYEISTGRFSRPHDTYAAVPLVNGLLGLFLLLRISILYIKRYKKNFFSLSVIPWLLLTFYYNAQFALVGLLLLYISSINFNDCQIDEDSLY